MVSQVGGLPRSLLKLDKNRNYRRVIWPALIATYVSSFEETGWSILDQVSSVAPKLQTNNKTGICMFTIVFPNWTFISNYPTKCFTFLWPEKLVNRSLKESNNVNVDQSFRESNTTNHNTKTIVFRLKQNLNCFFVKQACTKMWNIWSGIGWPCV